MKRILIYSLLPAFFPVLNCSGQDMHFSQFYMVPLVQNPGMAGALNDLEAVLDYKDQWQSITTPYRSLAFSFDTRLGKRNKSNGFWAGGINFYSDRAGDSHLGLTEMTVNLAYQLRLDRYNTLGAGFQLGGAERSIQYPDLKWGSQYNGTSFDAGLPSGEPQGLNYIFYPDVGAGIAWTHTDYDRTIEVTNNNEMRLDGGIGVYHVNRPLYSFYNRAERLYMRYVVQGDALLPVANTNMAVVPGFLAAFQGPSMEIYAGTMLRYLFRQDSKYTGYEKSVALSVGLFYRASDAMAVSSLVEFSNFAFGVSYDMNTSSLHKASNWRGGYEITLRFIRPESYSNGTHPLDQAMF